jgi:hypothetical protein
MKKPRRSAAVIGIRRRPRLEIWVLDAGKLPGRSNAIQQKSPAGRAGPVVKYAGHHEGAVPNPAYRARAAASIVSRGATYRQTLGRPAVLASPVTAASSRRRPQ